MAIHKIDGVDGTNNFPRKFVTLYASEAVTKGMLVALDLSDSTNGVGASIRPADVTTDATAGGGQPIALGFATEAAAAGGRCKVQTAGRFTDATVHTSTVIGDSLYASIVAGTAYPAAEAYAGINVFTVDPGSAAANNIAVTGILTTDEVVSCLHHDLSTASGTMVNLTDVTVTSDGNVQSAATATADTGDYVIVTWRRNLNKIAYALEADTAGAADVMILDQGLF
tara:strand:+ start:243 stop:920 length:678 start_codon:yes stop_codon:yes gene_type:complete